MHNPETSVIITTYNRRKFLEGAVSSVLAQTYPDFELIIVDDASSEDVVGMLGEKFKPEMDQGRIRYIRNDLNRERSYSRNRAMETSAAQYFSFLDDDDIWLDTHLKDAVGFLKDNPDTRAVFTNCIIDFPPAAPFILRKGLETGKGRRYKDMCINRQLVSGSTYTIAREVYDKLGGFTCGIEPAEDREYLARIVMNYNVGYVATATVRKLNPPDSFRARVIERHTTLAKERCWFLIQENSRKFSYPLSRGIRCSWYLHLAMSFLPELGKTKFYLGRAIMVYPLCLFYGATWSLILRVMMGRGIYAFFKGLKSKSGARPC